jgi:2-keto-3-deoxy-L-rhamnonate aldolase RhmA
MMETIMQFRQALRSGKKLVGIGITLSDPTVTDALGRSVDFVWVDLEHAVMSPEALSGHLMAARCHQVPSLVRVSAGTTPLIKSALDAGAQGIIAPQVRSVEEVKNIVADCRYPPLGRRGFGPRVPSDYGRNEGLDYLDQANQGVFVAVMIETAEALQAIQEIVRVPGLDSIVLGPADLTLSLGENRNTFSPRVEAALQKIISEALAAQCLIGAGMGIDLEYALHLAALGVQWLQIGQDFDYLIKGMDNIRVGFQERCHGDI